MGSGCRGFEGTAEGTGVRSGYVVYRLGHVRKKVVVRWKPALYIYDKRFG